MARVRDPGAERLQSDSQVYQAQDDWSAPVPATVPHASLCPDGQPHRTLHKTFEVLLLVSMPFC